MSSENHIADDRKKVRLIDANALPVTTLTDGEYWTKDVVYKRDIDEAPTVDAVEVVRCKDCWKSADGLCSYQFKNIPGKDFCGDGERKDNG